MSLPFQEQRKEAEMAYGIDIWPSRGDNRYCPNVLSVRQWSGRPGFNLRSSHTKYSKMVLDTALLNTLHYKVKIKDKVEQSKEWSSTLPYTSSYWKGSLRVTLD